MYIYAIWKMKLDYRKKSFLWWVCCIWVELVVDFSGIGSKLFVCFVVPVLYYDEICSCRAYCFTTVFWIEKNFFKQSKKTIALFFLSPVNFSHVHSLFLQISTWHVLMTRPVPDPFATSNDYCFKRSNLFPHWMSLLLSSWCTLLVSRLNINGDMPEGF